MDWGSLPYIGEDGKRRRVWVFVMTMGWSRACYVEPVRKADTAAFIQCHVNAFEYLDGVPRRCLYDNAKVVTLTRNQDGRVEWNLRMLDFALRVGFEMWLCQPYRAQTKGKVESGVKYVRRNPCSSQGQAMWPGLRFTNDADLNRQALEWCDVVANRRTHGRASSAEKVPATASTGSGWAPRCRWASGWARWRSGPATRWSRSVPGPNVLVNASSCPVSGLVGPGWMAARTGKRWRCTGPRRRGGTSLPIRVRTGGGRSEMIALEQARQHLETLGFKQAVEVLDNTLDTAASK